MNFSLLLYKTQTVKSYKRYRKLFSKRVRAQELRLALLLPPERLRAQRSRVDGDMLNTDYLNLKGSSQAQRPAGKLKEIDFLATPKGMRSALLYCIRSFLRHSYELEFRHDTKTTQKNLYQNLLKLIRGLTSSNASCS